MKLHKNKSKYIYKYEWQRSGAGRGRGSHSPSPFPNGRIFPGLGPDPRRGSYHCPHPRPQRGSDHTQTDLRDAVGGFGGGDRDRDREWLAVGSMVVAERQTLCDGGDVAVGERKGESGPAVVLTLSSVTVRERVDSEMNERVGES
ncbi:hypothetical protein CsSME_00040956 [Camellia sinensis var. sinensis]